MSRLLAFVAAHRVFTGLLVAGLVLRVVTLFAYRPALIYFDSTRYLERMRDLEPGTVRPAGYPAFLNVLPTEWHLAVVPAVQHLFGLAIAVLIYAVLARLDVPRTWAAIATAPVLLDGYQLNIEQYILAEALFDLLLVGACALLLWHRRPGVTAAAAAGTLLAAAVMTRASATIAIAAALVAVLLLRAHWSRAVALGLGFALPLVAYAAWFNSVHGYWAINGYGGQFLYARVAPFADCDEFDVPDDQRVLCPREPPDERPTIDDYMWNEKVSPVYDLELEPGERRQEVAGSFARKVVLNQPLDYASAVLEDFAFGFWPTHRERKGDLPAERWEFQRHYPVFRGPETRAILRDAGYDSGGVADDALTGFLRTWQNFVYLPGPLVALALVLGLVGVFRGRGRVRGAAFLFTFVALAVYAPSIAISQFSWRYQLPLLVLLPPAAAIGMIALRRQSPSRPAS